MDTHLFLPAFAIGIIAGLRSMTAPAVVSWAAHLNRIHLDFTWLAFLGHAITAAVITVLALAELVFDKLPKTPSRKAPGPFSARILIGGVCGAALFLSASEPAVTGFVLGALGGAAGTLGGYAARTGLARALKVPDFIVAVAEDLVAVLGGFLIVWRLA